MQRINCLFNVSLHCLQIYKKDKNKIEIEVLTGSEKNSFIHFNFAVDFFDF